jgi:hypothetical protein
MDSEFPVIRADPTVLFLFLISFGAVPTSFLLLSYFADLVIAITRIKALITTIKI